jgi:hypothetical protein
VKAYLGTQALSVPYHFPRATAAVLARRPQAVRRAGGQISAAAPLAGLAGTQIAPDAEERLRGALGR